MLRITLQSQPTQLLIHAIYERDSYYQFFSPSHPPPHIALLFIMNWKWFYTWSTMDHKCFYVRSRDDSAVWHVRQLKYCCSLMNSLVPSTKRRVLQKQIQEGVVFYRHWPPLQNGFLICMAVNWNAIRWFLSKSDPSSSSRILTIDPWKVTFMSTICVPYLTRFFCTTSIFQVDSCIIWKPFPFSIECFSQM